MTMTAEQLQNELESIHKAMDSFIANDISFFGAKILLVNRLKITMGEAEDRLRMYESITNKQLAR